MPHQPGGHRLGHLVLVGEVVGDAANDVAEHDAHQGHHDHIFKLDALDEMAQAKANSARLHRVEDGINSRASKMPNWAEEMVAPVVGETNLLLHSCWMIRPATLIPTPVHRMAKSRGSREMRNTSHCSPSPASRLCGLMSSTPTNRETPERIARIPP